MPPPPPDNRLTSREREVAQLAAEGLALGEIAERLYLSTNTVKTHLEHVYQKLGVRNRSQLTRVFIEQERNHPNG